MAEEGVVVAQRDVMAEEGVVVAQTDVMAEKGVVVAQTDVTAEEGVVVAQRDVMAQMGVVMTRIGFPAAQRNDVQWLRGVLRLRIGYCDMAQMFSCGSEGCCGSTSFVAIQRVRSGAVKRCGLVR